MKRTLFGFIVVITIVCFFGIIPSTADDNPDFIFGEETDVAEDIQTENTERAISSNNYAKEIYTSTAPSSGETYNTRATKVFSAGAAIYLTIRYYMASAGSRTIYYFITNAAGTALAGSTSVATVSAGSRVTYKILTISTAGVYILTPIIIAPGYYVIPSGFPFIVE